MEGARPPQSRVWAELNRLTAFPKSLTVPIPLDIIIIPHLCGFVNSFFKSFFYFFSKVDNRLCVPLGATSTTASRLPVSLSSVTSLLCVSIIPHLD